MSSLIWKINRLRSMGFLEIGHRAYQWSFQKVEKVLLNKGWTPCLKYTVKPKLSLFTPPKDWLVQWQQLYRIDQVELDELMNGKIHFFGHLPLEVDIPINWHRDPLTGIETPLSFGKELNYRDDRRVGNIKIVWELARHQHLIPLAVAYVCIGNDSYRQAVVDQIEGWIEDNPYGLGIHWCNALEVALRLISWTVVHSLLTIRDGKGGLFSAVADPKALGRAFYQQAWFVRHYLSRYSSANNHLIGELTGLWITCCVIDMGESGSRWANYAQLGLEREARLQIHEDGVNKEQACYYHLWVLEYLLFSWIVGLRSGRKFSETYRKRILAMTNFLRVITPEGGVPPQIGDSDDGFVTRFNISWPANAYQEVLASIESILEDKTCTLPPPQKCFWYSLCLGKLPKVSVEIKSKDKDNIYPAIFKEGGYAVLGNGSAHVLFDAGLLGYPSIAAHGHADALNICVALDGAWWLVDPGTYAYHSEQGWRDYFRSTCAHNTIQMDGLSQSEIGGPFLWVRHAHASLIDAGVETGKGQWAVGEHDGYKKFGALHVRKVEINDSCNEINITDEIKGSGEHWLEVYFHFAPDIQIEPGINKGTWLSSKSSTTRKMIIEVDDECNWGVKRGNESPKLGWYSPVLGRKVPTCTLHGIWRGCLPVRIESRLIVD